MELTHADIADIIRLVDSSTLDEMVLEVSGLRIELRRRSTAAPAHTAPCTPIATNASAAGSATTPASADSAARALEPGQVAVTAPMVGTFFRRPTPDAEPFVEVGSHIEAGDPLGLIEVMKLFTTIAAEQAGTVVAIEVEDAAMVEYDQMLLIIAPD